MAADNYRHAEDEYFKLRGQFDTGRINQEQFDEKLRELMIHDQQGRYWMLGADSGKWYFYDGANWVQGEPYAGATPPLNSPVESRPTTSPIPSFVPLTVNPQVAAYPLPTAYTAPPRGLPIVPVIVLVMIALAVAAFLLFQNRDRIFVAQRPAQITPILPPTITRAPSPTAGVLVPTNAPATLAPLATAVSTDIPPTAVPIVAPATLALPTNAPAVTLIVVTAEPPDTALLPTLLPSATTPPTAFPTAVPTNPPATATQAPPTNTAIPNFPPNIYVTKITYSNAPKRNQNVTFTATFLNTTGGTAQYNYLILLYDPNKPGNNKGFGESPPSAISIPPGESEFPITYVPVNGPGGCINLFMRAGWKVSAFEKPIFPNTSGDPVSVSFDVCP